jgi:hypothetical protein
MLSVNGGFIEKELYFFELRICEQNFSAGVNHKIKKKCIVFVWSKEEKRKKNVRKGENERKIFNIQVEFIIVSYYLTCDIIRM